MVSVIKFSQFTPSDPENPTNTVVGITDPSGGVNIKGPSTVQWTTATRPTMPYDGLMGYNTTTEAWEYYQGSTGLWLQFSTSTSGENWTVITAASINAEVNEGYIANRTSTPVQIVLPATFDEGDRILVMGMGTGGWSVVCNTGQKIVFGSLATSIDGAINSDIQYSNIEIKGMLPSTVWTMWSINSNPQII